MTNNKGSGIFFPNLRLSTGNFGFAIRDLCEAALDKWTKGVGSLFLALYSARSSQDKSK